jgi:hypothetical protein
MTGNDRKRTRLALSNALIAASLLAMSAQASAQGSRCTDEAASLRRAETQLPRLEVAPPDDQQIVCITLETNILFARRLAAHLSHCPRSQLAPQGDTWRRTEREYMDRFSERRCKTAIRSYRG